MTKKPMLSDVPAIDRITYAPVWHSSNTQNFNLDIGHNCDYACFALWEGARKKEEAVLAEIRKKFKIIGDFEIYWTEKNYNRNIDRLYERNSPVRTFTGWDKKIGKPPFRFLIARDESPRYTWKKSVSGRVEPTNDRVFAIKHKVRSLFDKKYQVHSSNNLSEFLAQTALVLGPNLAQRVMGGEGARNVLYQDLEGADGWKDWRQLCSVLNMASTYIVQRNHEEVCDDFKGGDVDFLTENCQRLASLANVYQRLDRPYKGRFCVSGKEVSADVRYIGDGYYCAAWQKSMLERRVRYNDLYIPAPDDAFFSLLYHCKIQKPHVDDKYYEILEELARVLRFDWFEVSCLSDDRRCADLVSGYMNACGYYFEYPVDPAVYCNKKVIRLLPGRRKTPRSIVRRIKKRLGRVRKVLAKRLIFTS